ncbi:Vmc-like lipoprotein signal peptide domain-containing protein [Microbacterium sp. NPDC077184]
MPTSFATATSASIAAIASSCRPTQASAPAHQKADETNVCSSASIPV